MLEAHPTRADGTSLNDDVGRLKAMEPLATERLVNEPNKRPERTPFERDRARVMHSSALRRLAAKTQVLGAGANDFVRNRLTHSLEVAQIARELGKAIGCDPDVVETAALAHDLGHPPFGHNGETALNQAAASCGGFEGNAQSLRILTRLEAKTFDAQGNSVGLNLTRATLDATIKYPWFKDDRPTPKYGAYREDSEVFHWVRAGAPDTVRSLEAQVMDLADDIAYCVHDVEDALVGKWFTFEDVNANRQAIWHVARDWYDPELDDAQLDEAWNRLQALPVWPLTSQDHTQRGLAALKTLTSELIGRFAQSAHSATMEHFGPGPHSRYQASLVINRETHAEITALKAVAAHFVMRAVDREAELAEEREIVTRLVEVFAAHEDKFLDPAFAEHYTQADSDEARLRVVVDQVASLTDSSARAWAHDILA